MILHRNKQKKTKEPVENLQNIISKWIKKIQES